MFVFEFIWFDFSEMNDAEMFFKQLNNVHESRYRGVDVETIFETELIDLSEYGTIVIVQHRLQE